MREDLGEKFNRLKVCIKRRNKGGQANLKVKNEKEDLRVIVYDRTNAHVLFIHLLMGRT